MIHWERERANKQEWDCLTGAMMEWSWKIDVVCLFFIPLAQLSCCCNARVCYVLFLWRSAYSVVLCCVFYVPLSCSGIRSYVDLAPGPPFFYAYFDIWTRNIICTHDESAQTAITFLFIHSVVTLPKRNQ